MNILFVLDAQAIIVLSVALILVFGIFKFVAKVFVKLVAAAIVIVFFAYILLYWRGGLLDLGNEDFILFELKKKYCVEQIDEIKCDCIIEKLEADIMPLYSTEEDRERLRKNKGEALDVMRKSLQANWPEIKSCLEANNAMDKWNELKEDFFITDLDSMLDDVLQKLED